MFFQRYLIIENKKCLMKVTPLCETEKQCAICSAAIADNNSDVFFEGIRNTDIEEHLII